jgi:c-di-GMP-binding flagellar brake protein YcgR
MSLNSLVLCSNEKIVRVLRRTLGDLDIGVVLCADAESALRMLTRRRFEAIIVDCADPGSAEVLRCARSAPCNKQAVAVAIVDPDTGLRSVFQLGGHFVLYKPVSSERAKASFRAARALMKRERRRNARVPVRIPVTIRNPGRTATFKVHTIDLSEGGMAVSCSGHSRPGGRCQAVFTLPGTKDTLELPAEFAWEGTGDQAGVRFLDVPPVAANQLQHWLKRNLADAEPDDPPVRCQLSDLSLGGCYLEISSPFPVSTHVTLTMRAAGVEVRVSAVVRVMHADRGMGLEFIQTTAQHRQEVERFLKMLSENRGLSPELLAQPEGLDRDTSWDSNEDSEGNDPLVELFRTQATAPVETFLDELRKQRTAAAASA